MKNVAIVLSFVLPLVSCSTDIEALTDRVVTTSAALSCAQFDTPDFELTRTQKNEILTEYGFRDEGELQDALLRVTADTHVAMDDLMDRMIDVMRDMCP